MAERFQSAEHEQFYAPSIGEHKEHQERLHQARSRYEQELRTINDIRLAPSEFGARIGKAFVRVLQCSLRGTDASLIEEFKEDLTALFGDEQKASRQVSGFMAEYTSARMLQEAGLEVYFPDTDQNQTADRIDKIDWFAHDPHSDRSFAITVKSYLLTEDAFYDNNYFYPLGDGANTDFLIGKLVSDQTLMSHNVNVHRAYEDARDSARSVVNSSSRYGTEPVFMLLPNANARYINPEEDVSRLTGEPGDGTLRIFRDEVSHVLQTSQPIDKGEKVA